MITVTVDHTFESWRKQARELLKQQVHPGTVVWQDTKAGSGLFSEAVNPPQNVSAVEVKVSSDFMSLARRVCAHRDEKRWGVLYRLLYRMTISGERHLLAMPSDIDTRQCQVWAKAVGRDIHKMHAFVRFRCIGLDETTGREEFVAWFEPMYRIVTLAAPFFEKRFAGMNWSILTPDESVSWDGEKLSFLPGVSREQVPDEDAHDDLWRTYYSSVFNPARLKVKAMQSEMPQKYWKNLPESRLIPQLISNSSSRVNEMLHTPERPVKPEPANAYLRSLKERAKVKTDRDSD